MLTIVNGVTSKQVLANEIINLLETMGLDGYFYLGYPVLGGIDGKIKVDALLVSEQTGIVLFDLETLAEENIRCSDTRASGADTRIAGMPCTCSVQ